MRRPEDRYTGAGDIYLPSRSKKIYLSELQYDEIPLVIGDL
jgi:hypothetical protein